MRTLKNEKTEKSLREMLDETNQALANIQSRMKNLHDLGFRLRYNSEFRSKIIKENSDVLGKYSGTEVCDILNICGNVMLELSKILHKDANTIPLPVGYKISYLMDCCFNPVMLKGTQCLLDKVSTEKIKIQPTNTRFYLECYFI